MMSLFRRRSNYGFANSACLRSWACLSWAVLVCFAGGGSAGAAVLKVTDTAATPGVSRWVSLSLQLSPAGGERIAAVQTDIRYDPQQLRPVSVSLGQKAGQAGKQADYVALGSSRLRIVVYGVNQTVITEGELAIVNFQLTACASPGLSLLTAEDVFCSSPEGGPVAVQALSGSVSISMPTAASSLKQARAYPNPFQPSLGHIRITFHPLTAGAQINVHQMTGEKIAEINALEGGWAAWDGRNHAGRPVASGIYLYVITNPRGEKKTGKVVIVR